MARLLEKTRSHFFVELAKKCPKFYLFLTYVPKTVFGCHFV